MLAKLLVGFAGLLLAAGTITPQTGAYTTKNGSQCTWFDLRTSQSKILLATAEITRDVHRAMAASTLETCTPAMNLKLKPETYC
uniref:Uncharacterized protein n=1 Tax=Amphimedon queenslandica TaxID=400682 RepID=A0A1X7ST86_AMPQE